VTDTIEAMTATWGLPGRIAIANSPLGGPVVTLFGPTGTGPAGTAVVALQGAQLLGWTPTGHDPVIWLSPVERLGTAKAVRGGSPVCWPWFGPHSADPTKPAHGFVRTRMWSIDDAGVTATGAWLALGLQTTPSDKALWPHAAKVQLRVHLEQQLEVSLTTINTGNTPFALSQALHTYFSIGDIADVDVTGFDGEVYQDKLDGGRRCHQSGAVVFPGEVDRIYDAHPVSAMATIHDRRLRRQITIGQTGSRSSVVWNPGHEKASRLADMGPEGWRKFVCVETTNAGDDVRELGAGDTHKMVATYSVARG
jgi:glucose-6-phosphate 1-epimerase